MKQLKKIIAIAALLLVVFSALSAQAKDKPMTEKEAVKLIADWPAVADWFEARGKAIEAAGNAGIPKALLTEKEFVAFLNKRGWTPERFSYVSGTAFSLILVVAMEKSNPEMSKQFDDAIAQIQASDLPAADKAEQIKSLNEAKASMLAISSDKEIDQGELEIVRKHYDELMKMAEEMDKGDDGDEED